MRPLIIGAAEKRLIADLIARAAQNERIITEGMVIPDNRPLTIVLPHGYSVTYTHERHGTGRYHHISISVDQPKKIPNDAAIRAICGEFTFTRKIEDCMVWLEQFGRDRHAVNVVESLDKSFSPAPDRPVALH